MALTKVGGDIIRQPLDIGSLNATTLQIGAATTVHTTGIDVGSGSVTGHNIHSTGIVTATSFVGPVTGNVTGNLTGNVTGNADTASNLTGSPSITVTNITASGNVSIAGTLTYEDVTNIDAVGVITARSDVSIADKIIHTGDTDTAIRFPAADTFTVETAGTERLRVFNDGSVRIGDSSINLAAVGSGPTLGINGSAPEITLRDSASGNPYAVMRTNDYGSLYLGADQGNNHSSSAIHFHIDNSEKLRIDSKGQASLKGTTTAFDGTGELDALQIYYETDSGQASIGPYSSGGSTHLSFYTNSGGAAATEKLRITYDGKLGLGEQSPDFKFHSKETGGSTIAGLFETNQTDSYISFQASGTTASSTVRIGAVADNFVAFVNGGERLRIKSDGKAYFTGSVGLDGQTSPAAAIHINNFGNSGYELKLTGNALQFNRSSNSYIDQVHDTGSILFRMTSSHTEAMRITSAGNIAINKTSSISAKLHIGDTSNNGALSQLVKLANDSSGSGTGAQLNLGAGNANESTSACIGGFYDGTGASFIIKTAGTYANQSTVGERVRVDGGGRMLLGQQRDFGGGTYYDDLTINNSNTATGSAGGAGIDLVSGNNSWGGYIFSDSDNHARGYLKYDHGDDAMVFGTSGSNRIYLDSDGKLILSNTARETPFIVGDGGMCIEQSYDGLLKALSLRNKHTDAAAATALSFSLNRVGGDQDFEAGEIKLIKDQSWTTTSSTIDGSMVFSTAYNGVLSEKLRISADGSLRVENSDYNDLIGCTGEHSGENNSQYKTNTKTNLSSGTWYTIAILPTGRGFASFMIQDTASSRHTCFYFNAGHQYGGSTTQNCINVIGCSGTHGTQVFGAIRIKAYGTYDGAMLQVYIQNGVSNVQAYMVGENLAPQRWRMRDWIPDGTDPTGLSNYNSIQANASGLSAYAHLDSLAGGGGVFGGHLIPGLNNTHPLGNGNFKWSAVYAHSGSIQTSDITLKRDITVLNDAEMRAAANISKQFKQYRWNDAYAEKGNNARYHSGIIAQTVRDAMLGEGLDPTRYGFYCIDTWYEDPEGNKINKFYPAGSLVDEDDPAFNTPDEGEPEIPENMSLVTRHSLRYEELLCFIAAYNEQRFASLESRLSALES